MYYRYNHVVDTCTIDTCIIDTCTYICTVDTCTVDACTVVFGIGCGVQLPSIYTS